MMDRALPAAYHCHHVVGWKTTAECTPISKSTKVESHSNRRIYLPVCAEHFFNQSHLLTVCMVIWYACFSACFCCMFFFPFLLLYSITFSLSLSVIFACMFSMFYVFYVFLYFFSFSFSYYGPCVWNKDMMMMSELRCIMSLLTLYFRMFLLKN